MYQESSSNLMLHLPDEFHEEGLGADTSRNEQSKDNSIFDSSSSYHSVKRYKYQYFYYLAQNYTNITYLFSCIHVVNL